MKRIIFVMAMILICCLMFGEEIEIVRDKTLLKDGPGNFYDTVSVLPVGGTAVVIGESTEDPGWIEIAFNNVKGFISKLALKEQKGGSRSDDPFAELDFSDVKKETKSAIAPASYTAAIKGFAIDYSRKNGVKTGNVDEIWSITEFKKRDFFKVRKETKLAYFPKKGELIGMGDTHINENLTALGLTASLDVLQQGVVMDAEMTKRMNVIANIITRQTIDYDVQYRVWIIRDDEPVIFSGPGGYIFLSDTVIKMLTDYRELVAVIAHEIGHVVMRHGIRDLAIAQTRHSAEAAFDELEEHMDDDALIVSDELEKVVDQAVKACVLVRDDKEEYEADEITIELLNRYKIPKTYLVSALTKIKKSLKSGYPRYKKQINTRIKKIK